MQQLQKEPTHRFIQLQILLLWLQQQQRQWMQVIPTRL
jgi:hypothetical protein